MSWVASTYGDDARELIGLLRAESTLSNTASVCTLSSEAAAAMHKARAGSCCRTCAAVAVEARPGGTCENLVVAAPGPADRDEVEHQADDEQ